MRFRECKRAFLNSESPSAYPALFFSTTFLHFRGSIQKRQLQPVFSVVFFRWVSTVVFPHPYAQCTVASRLGLGSGQTSPTWRPGCTTGAERAADGRAAECPGGVAPREGGGFFFAAKWLGREKTWDCGDFVNVGNFEFLYVYNTHTHKEKV